MRAAAQVAATAVDNSRGRAAEFARDLGSDVDVSLLFLGRKRIGWYLPVKICKDRKPCNRVVKTNPKGTAIGLGCACWYDCIYSVLDRIAGELHCLSG